MKAFVDSFDLSFIVIIIVRFALATVLSGVIGYEREHSQRPAGFRTHILVCVGACLVMLTSEYMFRSYQGKTNLDPARLGAQVISGIGFLGAGTIIRDGSNVKGLTTAASLWAVSCIGLACGIGFYSGAVIATGMTYMTLLLLKKIEPIAHKNMKPQETALIIDLNRKNHDILAIVHLIESFQVLVRGIQHIYSISLTEDTVRVRILTSHLNPARLTELIDKLHQEHRVIRVFEDGSDLDTGSS